MKNVDDNDSDKLSNSLHSTVKCDDSDKVSLSEKPMNTVHEDATNKRLPQLSLKESRHFQKTRSFSAVEDTPDKKVMKDKLKTIPDFPLKDGSHSRSEHLETQSLLQHDDSLKEVDSNLLASSNTVVDHADEYLKPTPSSSVNMTNKLDTCGDTLIMQFDYFSNDQPMSLQHDSRLECSMSQSKGNHLRKSGRDLTELESDVARGMYDKSKSGRSRPRSASNTTFSHLPLSLILSTL